MLVCVFNVSLINECQLTLQMIVNIAQDRLTFTGAAIIADWQLTFTPNIQSEWTFKWGQVSLTIRVYHCCVMFGLNQDGA